MQRNPIEEHRVSETAQRAARGAHLTLRGLRRQYGGRSVLDAVDLTIAPGEFIAVVGRSGCGKSTLPRAIAGLEQPDAGQASIGGASGGKKPEVRMMFQDARLLPWKTVLQNVALGLALARALVHEGGFTAVLVTHDVQEAVVLADRILLIEEGRLALDLEVGLARPRARGGVDFGSLEQKVLDRVLGEHAHALKMSESSPVCTSLWLGCSDTLPISPELHVQ